MQQLSASSTRSADALPGPAQSVRHDGLIRCARIDTPFVKTSFVEQQAEARLDQLDRAERERELRIAERAEQERATQHQASAAARAPAGRRRPGRHRAPRTVAQAFGPAAAEARPERQRLGGPASRPVRRAHAQPRPAPQPGARRRRRRDPSWALQQRLQSALNVGVDAPLILRAEQLQRAVGLTLLVDPSIADLRAHAAWSGGVPTLKPGREPSMTVDVSDDSAVGAGRAEWPARRRRLRWRRARALLQPGRRGGAN